MDFRGNFQHPLTHAMADQFLLWAVEEGASDIIFRPDDPPWIQVEGSWQVLPPHLSLSLSETQLLTNYFSGQDHKAGNVQRGVSVDFAYSLRIPNLRGVFQRFRVNVTATNCGHYLVLRALPRTLPVLYDLGLEPTLIPYLYPSQGLVLISGVMGSGKSTLLAGILHSALLKAEYGGLGLGRQILTLEHPIEFDLASIPYDLRSAPVAQSEIFRHVESWAQGVRSMTRRKGEIVMVGEARDRETLRAMLGIVEQGVTCYATVHAQDVPQTLTRIIHAFPLEEQSSMAAVLKANLRLIIHQRLVPSLKPTKSFKALKDDSLGPHKRLALREFLVFKEDLRLKLYETKDEELIPTVRSLVEQYGQSLAATAKSYYEEGFLSLENYLKLDPQAKT